MVRSLCVTFCLLMGTAAQAADAPSSPLVESYLVAGRLADGDAALAAHLTQHPDDAQARYGQGVLQQTKSPVLEVRVGRNGRRSRVDSQRTADESDAVDR